MISQEDLKLIGQEVGKQIESSTTEVLDAINKFANDTEQRLQSLESDVGSLKSNVGSLKSDVGSLKSDVQWIKANMVTQDFLDTKLTDLKGDIIVTIRKEDTKLTALIQELINQHVLSAEAAKRILSMEPFAQLVS